MHIISLKDIKLVYEMGYSAIDKSWTSGNALLLNGYDDDSSLNYEGDA